MKGPFGIWQSGYAFPVKIEDGLADLSVTLFQFERGVLPSQMEGLSGHYALVIASPKLAESKPLANVCLYGLGDVFHAFFHNRTELHIAGDVQRFTAAARQAGFAPRHMDRVDQLLADIESRRPLQPEPAAGARDAALIRAIGRSIAGAKPGIRP